MKKIIIFSLFVVFVTSCVAQNYEIFTNLKNAVESYETYLTNGNFRRATALEDDLLRYCAWLVLNLYSSADYNADSLAYAKDKLDVVAGVELNEPTYTYDASFASYVTFDSVRITGDSWVAYFHTTDSINSLINAKVSGASGQIGIFSGTNTLSGKDSIKWTAGRLILIGKGVGNMSVGDGAGASITSGLNNTNLGISAGASITTASSNTNVGKTAGSSITSGINNSNFGVSAGKLITTGHSNCNFGLVAGQSLTTGAYNCAYGVSSNNNLTTGNYNSSYGYLAGYSITTGTYNNNFGNDAGYAITTGNYNNNFGNFSGFNITTGDRNINIGYMAGAGIEEGSYNINIGDSAGYSCNDSCNLFIESSSANKFNALIWGDFANDSLRLNGTVKIKTDLQVRDTNIIDLIEQHSSTVALLDSISDHRTDINALAPSGNQYALQMSNGDGTFTSDADFTIQSDSLRGVNISINGATRFSKFKQSDTLGMYLTPNGVVDTMEWSRSAAWMLEHAKDIEPFDYFFNTRVNGEVNWPRCYGDSYHSINPSTAKAQYMGAFERTWIYMDDLYEKNNDLETEVNKQKEKIRQLEQNIDITQALTIQLLNKIKELEKKIDE